MLIIDLSTSWTGHELSWFSHGREGVAAQDGEAAQDGVAARDRVAVQDITAFESTMWIENEIMEVVISKFSAYQECVCYKMGLEAIFELEQGLGPSYGHFFQILD